VIVYPDSAQHLHPRFVRARRVFTATKASVIEDGVVEIERDRIVNVGQAHEFGVRVEGVEVTHFPDATLLPGTIDAHCHVTMDPSHRTYEEAEGDSDELLALTAVGNLRSHLACGVTTLRDLGGRNSVTFSVREAVRRGHITGPRMLLAGRPVTHSSGHAHSLNGVADGMDAIRRNIRQLVAEGADVIKVMASGGGTVGTSPHLPAFTIEELKTAVETAHSLDVQVVAHCRATGGIANAVRAGVDCIEHAEFVTAGDYVHDCGRVEIPRRSVGRMVFDQAVADLMAEANVTVSFSSQAGGYSAYRPLAESRSAGVEFSESDGYRLAGWDEYFSDKTEILRRLHGDGFTPRLATSSDAGPADDPFIGLQDGLDIAIAAGLSTTEALMSVTATAADVCGISDHVGRLAPGLFADLLVVGGDPLSDVTQTRHVAAVYLGGRLQTPQLQCSPSQSLN
jgi:imidazolonepropionase-like amidohydrolase